MAAAKMEIGGAQLTLSEARVFTSLLRGNANKDIAEELGCTVKTVEFHVSNILRKTGQSSRAKLIASQRYAEFIEPGEAGLRSESRLRVTEPPAADPVQ